MEIGNYLVHKLINSKNKAQIKFNYNKLKSKIMISPKIN